MFKVSNSRLRIFLGAFLCAACGLMPGTVEASFIIQYNASADPTTEGFTPIACCGSSTAGPIANDMGLPAWSITALAMSSQYGYASGALSIAQKADIASQGFILTMTARVIQGAAPIYDTTNYTTIGGAMLSTDQGRFEVNLGLDSNGDTVAVLATYLDSFGPGGSIRTLGPSYTLTGSGNSYHNYQLVYNPTTQLADLFVDGIDRIQGYGGFSQFRDDYGLEWFADSGGQGNFNFVELATPQAAVPEPSSLLLLGTGALGLVGYGWRRKGAKDQAK